MTVTIGELTNTDRALSITICDNIISNGNITVNIINTSLTQPRPIPRTRQDPAMTRKEDSRAISDYCLPHHDSDHEPDRTQLGDSYSPARYQFDSTNTMTMTPPRPAMTPAHNPVDA